MSPLQLVDVIVYFRKRVQQQEAAAHAANAMSDVVGAAPRTLSPSTPIDEDEVARQLGACSCGVWLTERTAQVARSAVVASVARSSRCAQSARGALAAPAAPLPPSPSAMPTSPLLVRRAGTRRASAQHDRR